MDLETGLNKQQIQAISANLGAVQILAGPGSGKTKVLTLRIAYLISQLGIRPFNILAVTFTNKAASEMNERVNEILAGNNRGLTLGTFHSICARFLRREAEHLPVNSNFVIFDADDQRGLIKAILKEFNLDPKVYRPINVQNSISQAKNELLRPEEYALNTYRDEVHQRIYKRYQDLLVGNNAVDFDDILMYMALLLEEKPDVRAYYADRFQHILVDEFQDTNQAQYTLVKHLASHHKNIFVVGDSDQSIYRWRGADYRNLSRFEKDFPNAQIILLEQNYRSTQNILDAAVAVIDQNSNRTPKHLFSEIGAGQKINFNQSIDAKEEGRYIVESIASLVGNGGHDPGDFAIMYRTNAQSRLIEESFLQANLPYKLVGAQRFYGRREIKDLLAYLRLIHNPSDDVSFQRVINTPRRKIGKKTIDQIRATSQENNLQMGTFLIKAGEDNSNTLLQGFTNAAQRSLEHFGKLLIGWVNAKSQLELLALLDKILEEIDYQTYLDDGTDEGLDRWENVLELRRLAAEYDSKPIGEFLEKIALVSDQDTVDINAKVPTLLTLHAAKGLEFPVVFITGLEEGTLPHARSFEDPEEMEEERRLFYVGITRAKSQLFLTHALNRRTYGYSEPTDPSRFLDDIPSHLIFGNSNLELTKHTRAKYDLSISTWEDTLSTAPIITLRYEAKQLVKHPTYGDGVVLESVMEGGEEVVKIEFKEAGIKKLIASLAKLTIIS
jgi:DNA helicase II / ATP-dependent DNA helicase PcrA